MIGQRLLWLNGFLLLAVLGSRWSVQAETQSLVQKDYLRPLKLDYKGWATHDLALTPTEMRVLEPDAVMVRRFQSPNWFIRQKRVRIGHA